MKKFEEEEIIKEAYDEVKRRCEAPSNAYGIGAWTHHIELVYKIEFKIMKNIMQIIIL